MSGWNVAMDGRAEFEGGGKPLAAALLGVACGAAPLPFNVLPLVMGPLNREFGWDFAQIGAGATVFGIIASLMAPATGGQARRAARGTHLAVALRPAASHS